MAMLSGFATLFALNAVNPDSLVARVNLGRSAADREVDFTYLARLSGDAQSQVVTALTSAAPSLESCTAARTLRTKWLNRDEATWNLGARRGRASVSRTLTEGELARLCVGTPAISAESVPTLEPAPAAPPVTPP
jgi:hypothetical protein